MDEHKRSRLDFWQNIVIVVLSLSAAVLFSRTQLYQLASSTIRQSFDLLMETPGQMESIDNTRTTSLSLPVHVAVSGAYGRFGDMSAVTSGDSFRPLGDLLKEALGSSRVYTVCSEGEFLDALDNTSVYYDFLNPLPLSILADSISADTDNIQARRFILSARNEPNVHLYLQDDSGTYRFCSTAVSRSDLESIADSYELGNATFAFELAKTNSAYATVDPCTLFLTDSRSTLPLLYVSRMLTNTDQLLTSLGFNPRTNYRYPESDGTEVIVEGERSLRIRPDGTVLYRSGGEASLSIDAADPNAPTAREVAAGAEALLQTLTGTAGDGRLHLRAISHEEDTSVLQFGYHVNGTPVRFSDDSYAAEVTLEGSVITSLSLRFRQYTAADEQSLLLPLRQALAIASQSGGISLAIGYADNGAETMAACWLTE